MKPPASRLGRQQRVDLGAEGVIASAARASSAAASARAGRSATSMNTRRTSRRLSWSWALIPHESWLSIPIQHRPRIRPQSGRRARRDAERLRRLIHAQAGEEPQPNRRRPPRGPHSSKRVTGASTARIWSESAEASAPTSPISFSRSVSRHRARPGARA